MQALTPIRVTLSSKPDTYSGRPFGIAPSGAWKQYLQYDLEICEVHTDLNVADPFTKPLSRAKHDQHQDSMGVRIITM